MRGLRQFVRTQWRGGLLAVVVAYSLTIQGLMASVGLGMAAGTTRDPAGFVLCSAVGHQNAPAPGDRQAPAPQCPFCFVAAQSAGLAATADNAPAFPAYAGSVMTVLSRQVGDDLRVARVRRSLGEPRAPPAFSV